jgi:hypothetical protein
MWRARRLRASSRHFSDASERHQHRRQAIPPAMFVPVGRLHVKPARQFPAGPPMPLELFAMIMAHMPQPVSRAIEIVGPFLRPLLPD